MPASRSQPRGRLRTGRNSPSTPASVATTPALADARVRPVYSLIHLASSLHRLWKAHCRGSAVALKSHVPEKRVGHFASQGDKGRGAFLRARPQTGRQGCKGRGRGAVQPDQGRDTRWPSRSGNEAPADAVLGEVFRRLAQHLGADLQQSPRARPGADPARRGNLRGRHAIRTPARAAPHVRRRLMSG